MADRALSVPELLENVLVFLPIKDLGRAQRVSRFWLKVITDSPNLQENLFLKSKSPTMTFLTSSCTINPLLEPKDKGFRGWKGITGKLLSIKSSFGHYNQRQLSMFISMPPAGFVCMQRRGAGHAFVWAEAPLTIYDLERHLYTCRSRTDDWEPDDEVLLWHVDKLSPGLAKIAS